MSSNHGFDFAAVINEMAEAGYSLWWQVLNAKDFGVPQNRERIFVVGFRDGSPREVFFERGNDQTHIKQDSSQSGRILKSPIRSQGDKPMIVSRQPLKFLDRNQKNIEGDYAFTVDSMNTGGVKIDSCIRRLTPTECERLMGLPDNWTKYGNFEDGKLYCDNCFEQEGKCNCDEDLVGYTKISDSQRYKLCGNGVVVNVVEEIIKKLIL